MRAQNHKDALKHHLFVIDECFRRYSHLPHHVNIFENVRQ